jgi:hypothetical protein
LGKGYVPNSIDRARDELFSHIRRCGVLEAEDDQRDEWFDDTIEFLGERFPELTPDELVQLRTIGERYCAPAIPHGGNGAAGSSKAEEPEEVADEEEVVDSGEVSAV